MRRFSQRNSLVTLSEINVTPLLDLAFVLLIIFIITTPVLEQSINLKLPVGGGGKRTASLQDAVLAEVGRDGVYYVKGRRVGDVAALEAALVQEYRRNTNMFVQLRADREGPYKYPVGIIEAAQRQGITSFRLMTEPGARR
ncbi:MAG: biopolymer transporter ExbD [Verrucomicrobiae bacterium]|nr:biopolymer transporter ExbD [Verrucomicrobiae bacterium]